MSHHSPLSGQIRMKKSVKYLCLEAIVIPKLGDIFGNH